MPSAHKTSKKRVNQNTAPAYTTIELITRYVLQLQFPHDTAGNIFSDPQKRVKLVLHYFIWLLPSIV